MVTVDPETVPMLLVPAGIGLLIWTAGTFVTATLGVFVTVTFRLEFDTVTVDPETFVVESETIRGLFETVTVGVPAIETGTVP